MNQRREIGLKFVLAIACWVGLSPAVWGQTPCAERAPEWEKMFSGSRAGFTGADGIYSIPLNGPDLPGANVSHTLFVFGDTFVGRLRADGSHAGGTRMVNNCMALLTGTRPDPNAIVFDWGHDERNRAVSIVIPDTPNAQPGDWYWFKDGVTVGPMLYLFASRMHRSTPQDGPFNFQTVGAALLIADLRPTGGQPRRIAAGIRQLELPFFLPAESGRGERGLGEAILNNTEAGGAPLPDGYLYIYGLQNDPLNKQLLAASVRPEDLENPDAYSFWDGQRWVSGFENAAPLAGRVSSELSVTPLSDGRCVLVSQQDGLGPRTQLAFGASPVGPFGPAQVIWTCPEQSADGEVFCYNAKAHPHLSRPGTLLISYNVNATKFERSLADASIYRPRFIRVELE